jgi:hypothetical protein
MSINRRNCYTEIDALIAQLAAVKGLGIVGDRRHIASKMFPLANEMPVGLPIQFSGQLDAGKSSHLFKVFDPVTILELFLPPAGLRKEK